MDLPETLTIEINPPVEFKGQTFSELNLREPKAAEMRRAEQNMGGDGRVTLATLTNRKIWLVSLVAGVPVPVAEALPISVLLRAANYLEGFTVPGPEIGEN
jgi:hypothetical protein